MSSNIAIPTSQPSARVPRPPNKWVLFLKDFRRLYQLRDDRDRSLDRTGLSGLASVLWATYTPEEKEQWKERAKEASERHAVLFPNYKYQPKKKGGKERAKKPRGRKLKGKGKEDTGKKTAEPSRTFRFVPYSYSRLSSEDLGGFSDPVVPPLTGPHELAFDLERSIRPHVLNSPARLPPHTFQEFTPAQAAIFAGWSWESAQASTNIRAPEECIGPHDVPEGFQMPASSSLHPSALPLSDIVPGMDVLDQFLKNHPEDQGDVDMSPPQPVVESTGDSVDLGGFGPV